MTVLQFSLVLFISIGSLSAVAYYFANLAEDGINDDTKKKLIRRLKQFRISSGTRVAFETFLFASDRLYGRKLFSIRAFFCSAIFTILWFLFVFVVSALLFPSYKSLFSTSIFHNLIWKYAFIFLSGGLVIDFFSCVATRVVVRWSLRHTKIPLITIAAADLIFSIFWFYMTFSFFKMILISGDFLSIVESLKVWLNFDGLPIAMKTLNDLTADMFQREPSGSISIVGGLNTEVVYAFPEGILFFSSLLTSVWLWLYIASYWAHRTALRFDVIKSKLIGILNIDNKPFKSIGIVSIVFIYPFFVFVSIIIFMIFKLIR